MKVSNLTKGQKLIKMSAYYYKLKKLFENKN